MGLNILAKPTFMAGPEEALIAADAYSSGEVTTIDSDISNYGLDIPNSPVGIKIKPPAIPGLELLNPFQAGLGLKVEGLSQADILERVVNNNVSIKNCFTNMSDAAKNLLKIPGELLNKIETTINGVVNKIKNLSNFDPSETLKRIGDLKAIGCTANTLTNGKYDLTITDKGGLSGLISGITSQANTLGINNVFSSISATINDKDVLLSAVKNILPNAVKDINLLKDLSTTSIANNIKSIMPNISGNVIDNFRIEPGTKNYELPIIFNNLSNTLDIIDNTWNKVTRNGETILNGNLLTSPSAIDFHKTLTSSVMYDPLPFIIPSNGDIFELPKYDKPEMFLMLVNNIGEQTVQESLKESFPILPIVVNDTLNNNISSDKNKYNLNSSDTSYKELTNNTIIQSIKIDNNTQKINVKKFSDEGVLLID